MSKSSYRKKPKRKTKPNVQQIKQEEFENIKYYEDYFSRVKASKKYTKSLEYLDVFKHSKRDWKFNVFKFLIKEKLAKLYNQIHFNQ